MDTVDQETNPGSDDQFVQTEVTASTPIATADEQLNSLGGAFVGSLRRSNKQIRSDRALSIAQKAKRSFARAIEDITDQISELQIERENMLDMSPTNTQSLILASDFQPDAFVNKDLELGIKLRNLEIKLDVARRRFSYLFGKA